MNFVKALALLLATAPTITADVPWFVLVSNTEEGQGFNRCGAALVHPDIIITAGDCVNKNDYLRVGYRTDKDSEIIMTPRFIYSHPDQWKKNGRTQENLPNDIQIIKMNQAVEGIEPVKLYDGCCGYDDDNTQLLNFAQAGSPKDVKDPPNGPVGNPPEPYIMGGFEIASSYEKRLKEGQVYTEEFVHCVREYIALPGYHAQLDEDVQFCANANTSSPCDANAWGSPLYTNEEDEPVLVGMASQGQCTPGGLPFVYTRIAHYYDYIRQNICRMSSVQHNNTDCSEYIFEN